MHYHHRSLRRPLRAGLWLERHLTTQQFTFAQLWRMFVPLVFDQLFIYLINILSVSMVSSSGEAAVAAVSMVGSLGMIISAVFAGLSTGGSILVAQARGAQDDERVRQCIGQTILLAGAAAVAATAAFAGFAGPMVRALYPMAEPLLIEYASQYLFLISLSYIPYALYNAIFSIYRGLGDSKSSLALTIVINSTHLVCSFVCINGLQLGVTGSGLSYIIARVVGAGMAVLWLFHMRNPVGMRFGYLLRVSHAIQRGIFRVGLPMSLEQILFQAGAVVAQLYIATLSTATIAANGIAASAYNLYYATAFALTTLTTTVCGQCFGAHLPDLAQQYCASFTKMGRVLILGTVLVVSPFMPLVLRLYSPSAEALPQIYLALGIGAVLMPMVWSDAYVPPSAMRAAGDSLAVTIISLMAMWIGRVLVGGVLTIPCGLGIAGVWLSYGAEWLLRLILFRARLRSGRWMRGTAAQA